MATTPNLNLPLIDDNTTNDIKRDFNALANAVDQSVSSITIPPASLTEAGKVQLSDAINSTDKTKAATPSAVKLAYDEATAAKQLGVEQKNSVVAALNSIGVSASTSESWTQLINKMSGVIKATGNAVPAQVLAGATFSNASGNGRTGTMPNRSAQSAHQLAKLTEVWPGDRAFMMPPDGYYDGQSWVYALTPDLLPTNIRSGKNILGVAGTIIEGPRYATGRAVGGDVARTFSGLRGPITNVFIQISGLSFRPNRIIISRPFDTPGANEYSRAEQGIYDWETRRATPSAETSGDNYSYMSLSANTGIYVREMTGALTNPNGAYVNDSGFLVPVMSSSTYMWEAFRV